MNVQDSVVQQVSMRALWRRLAVARGLGPGQTASETAPRKLARFLLIALACLAGFASQGANATAARQISINGPIGPAQAGYVENALSQASKADVPVVILRLDTPGGLAQPMRRIVKAVLASHVPIIGYVAPSGARAASAGTYILYACDIAAMAPATNVGAATPVQLGLDGQPTGDDDSQDGHKNNQPTSQSSANAGPADSQTAKRRKTVNDSVAYLRGLAERNGRNADWAEQAVRAGASISAETAKSKDVVNLIAPNERALLKRVDGRQLRIHGTSVTLDTAGLGITVDRPGWHTQLLGFITQPTVALLFFVVGVIGIVGELFAPGTAVPGVVGALSLITGLYGFHLLPVDYAGLGLVALGVTLIIAEAFVPSFGALGLGGIAAFVFGCWMLISTPAAAFGVPPALIAAIAAAAAGIVVLTATLLARARRTRVRTANDGLIGADCVALESFSQSGRVRLHGESWRAQTSTPIAADFPARVTSVSGLTLSIEPVPQSTESSSGE